ncbi:hypothetical protein [Hoeflea prorocentri]|uniref:Uncharacterized protein n=1 Tax=Hoeflea prorocentri TaxID=1922333 RepID=A0A9X3ZHK5_9HYPH|nr:hypothetical protein [Hoeflea prorocentri]MCY6381942.1 hypothetical protein [Hoeflea prorocentri]MDA5399742.1 hypothetical protein [Hoeflea prorocentri]
MKNFNKTDRRFLQNVVIYAFSWSSVPGWAGFISKMKAAVHRAINRVQHYSKRSNRFGKRIGSIKDFEAEVNRRRSKSLKASAGSCIAVEEALHIHW